MNHIARVSLFVLAALAVIVTIPATAPAQEPEGRAEAEALLETGRQHQVAKRFEEAIVAYERAVEVDPTYAAAYWEMGWSHWSLGQFDRTIELWEKTLELDPAYPEAADYLLIERENKRLREAEVGSDRPPLPAEPSEVGEARLLLAAVGDTMMGDAGGGAGRVPPDDARGMFDEVTPYLEKADIAFANLEGVMADSGSSSKCRPDSQKCYAFRMPTALGPRLVEAGVDVVSVANNHANDYGSTGRTRTRETLDALGIAHSGPVGDLASLEANGVTVGLVAMATSPGLYNINRIDEAALVVSELAATHDIVVVSFHGGAEGASALHVPEGMERAFGENRGNLREFSHRMIDAGADLLIGHGPHVPRGMQLYQNRLIAYSLGNFFTYRFNVKGNLGLGPLLMVYLDEHGAFVEGEIVPTKQTYASGPIIDPEGAVISLVRQLSEEDFGDTAPVITDEGKILPRSQP